MGECIGLWSQGCDWLGASIRSSREPLGSPWVLPLAWLFLQRARAMAGVCLPDRVCLRWSSPDLPLEPLRVTLPRLSTPLKGSSGHSSDACSKLRALVAGLGILLVKPQTRELEKTTHESKRNPQNFQVWKATGRFVLLRREGWHLPKLRVDEATLSRWRSREAERGSTPVGGEPLRPSPGPALGRLSLPGAGGMANLRNHKARWDPECCSPRRGGCFENKQAWCSYRTTTLRFCSCISLGEVLPFSTLKSMPDFLL